MNKASRPSFSVIIPARNEQEYIPQCLKAIERAATEVAPSTVEVVVVINRCTDRTEELARAHGCVVVYEDAKNLAVIRNKGIFAAQGEVIITVDADSEINKAFLQEVGRALSRPSVVGGGCAMLPNRWSLGIICTGILVGVLLLWYRVSVGAFFARRETFEALGGFDERLSSVEDIDFARRLKAFGRERGQRFVTLLRARITTSCRKFDSLGDWYFFLNPLKTLRLLKGRSQRDANDFWYDFKR